MYLHNAMHEILGLKTHKLQSALLYVNQGGSVFTSTTELHVVFL